MKHSAYFPLKIFSCRPSRDGAERVWKDVLIVSIVYMHNFAMWPITTSTGCLGNWKVWTKFWHFFVREPQAMHAQDSANTYSISLQQWTQRTIALTRQRNVFMSSSVSLIYVTVYDSSSITLSARLFSQVTRATVMTVRSLGDAHRRHN